MRMDFVKMEGCGNDFVVLDRLRRPDAPVPPADVIASLADRRTGIGFDQLLVVEADAAGTCPAAFRIFNADGSAAMQCGNGARCIAAFLTQDHDFPQEFTLASPAGAMAARVSGDRVRVGMGLPEFTPARIPFAGAPVEATTYRIEVGGETVTLGALSMGNPHAVILVEDTGAAPVETLGPAIAQHPAFPAGVNVGFLEVVSRHGGRLRVFERGAGETAACGSGACAAMVTGRRLGLFDAEVALDLAGGTLVISWRGANEPVWLEGPANRVYEGHTTL
jgi:diaminopimelate epimerase